MGGVLLAKYRPDTPGHSAPDSTAAALILCRRSRVLAATRTGYAASPPSDCPAAAIS